MSKFIYSETIRNGFTTFKGQRIHFDESGIAEIEEGMYKMLIQIPGFQEIKNVEKPLNDIKGITNKIEYFQSEIRKLEKRKHDLLKQVAPKSVKKAQTVDDRVQEARESDKKFRKYLDEEQKALNAEEEKYLDDKKAQMKIEKAPKPDAEVADMEKSEYSEEELKKISEAETESGADEKSETPVKKSAAKKKPAAKKKKAAKK